MTGTTGGDTERMEAIVVHEFGDRADLPRETVRKPTPDRDEVLVRVGGAGVNPIDWLVRRGYSDDAVNVSPPWIPGWDLAGDVAAVGPGVDAFGVGDAVFGMARMPDPGRTYAEYAAVPASDVAHEPESLSHVEAAALPMVSLTAWQALFGRAGLADGDRVLVHAAAGGVGHVAVQLATHAGATVAGTASGYNETYLRKLGVDEFVNYRETDFGDVLDPVDVVVDGVGGDTLERSYEVVASGGEVVTLPGPIPKERAETARRERGVDTHWFSVEPDAATLAEVRDLVESGYLAPTVSDVFPLREAATAHEASEDGHVRGKLVLDPTLE